MKKVLFAGILASLLWLVGCGNNALRYEKLHFEDEELAKNWVVENYEGITAKVKEAVPDHLTAELYDNLEQGIVFLGWDGVYTEQEDGWYMVRPTKESVSAAVDTASEGERAAGQRSGWKQSETYPGFYRGLSGADSACRGLPDR